MHVFQERLYKSMVIRICMINRILSLSMAHGFAPCLRVWLFRKANKHFYFHMYNSSNTCNYRVYVDAEGFEVQLFYKGYYNMQSWVFYKTVFPKNKKQGLLSSLTNFIFHLVWLSTRLALTNWLKLPIVLYNTTYSMQANTTYIATYLFTETNRIRGRPKERMTQALLATHLSVYPSIWFAFVWMSLILQLLPQQIPVPPLPLPTCCCCQLRTETAEVPWTWGRNMLVSAGPGAEPHWDTLDWMKCWRKSGGKRTCCSVWEQWSDYGDDKES